MLGGVGVIALAGCAADDSSTSAANADPGGAPRAGGGGGSDSTVQVADGEIPEETAGPYPGDGTNGPCDRGGNYPMYDGDAVDENYLRGGQEAADDGTLEFTTIFPACYAGRWPHMHFEVYESLDAATSGSGKLRTFQLALPQDVCETVYATDGYEQSVSNLAQVSLDSDGTFSDGYSLQMAKLTGSVEAGYVATLNVPV